MKLLSISSSWMLAIVNYANLWTEIEEFTEISPALFVCYTSVQLGCAKRA